MHVQEEQLEDTKGVTVWFMVLNAAFNKASIISWRAVLLVEETGVLEKNPRPAENHRQTLSHNVVSRTPGLSGIRTPKVSGDRH